LLVLCTSLTCVLARLDPAARHTVPHIRSNEARRVPEADARDVVRNRGHVQIFWHRHWFVRPFFTLLPVSQLKTHPRFTPPSPPCHSVVTPTEKSASFYVGDSAGRKGDFSATASDRKFALNVGVDFRTPEVSSPSHVSFELRILIQVGGHRNIFLANRLQSTRSQGFIRLPFQLGVRARSLPEHLGCLTDTNETGRPALRPYFNTSCPRPAFRWETSSRVIRRVPSNRQNGTI